MHIKKYSMFYSLNIRYTVNINKEHEKESVKGKGENSYERKKLFYSLWQYCLDFQLPHVVLIMRNRQYRHNKTGR